jgi:hypothetical protein
MKKTNEINAELHEIKIIIDRLINNQATPENIQLISNLKNQMRNLKDEWKTSFYHELSAEEKHIFKANEIRLGELFIQLENLDIQLADPNLLPEEKSNLRELEFKIRSEVDKLKKYFWSDFEKYEFDMAMNNLRNKMR